MKFWTIGHFSHPLPVFVQLLVQHQIKRLVDVRRFPGSRTVPQFNRESLGDSLADQQIDYRWLESLGGRRGKVSNVSDSPNEGWRNKSFRNYADYMGTAEFRSGFAELESLARDDPTAIMCSEAVFWRCHRRLISDYAVASGGDVEHIFPDGRTKPHTLTAIASVDASSAPLQLTYPAPATLFD